MGRIRVLVADDQPMIFDSVRRILEPECEIVGEVQDGAALIKAAEALHPDVIVADITMPGIDGIEAARRLRTSNSAIPIVMLTMHRDLAHLDAALKAGASAFVLKNTAGEELLPAIAAALKGGVFIDPQMAPGTITDRPIKPRRH